MDYGFAPGGTGFDNSARNYLDWRPHSEVPMPIDVTVSSFIFVLEQAGTIQHPIGDLGIGCHGHWAGFLDIRLDANSGSRAFYKDLDRVATAGTLTIPSTVLNPRPVLGGIEIKAIFRIVGCGIGAARPYLLRLKAALGNDVLVVATHHDDSANPATFGSETGVLRMLLYDFRVLSPVELKTKAEVVDAFDAKKFKWYEGTDVPRDFWEKRVPTDVITIGRAASQRWIDYQPAIAGVTYTLIPGNIWKHEHEPLFDYHVTPPTAKLELPAERRAFMRPFLEGRPEMKASHAFPLYQQRGYPSFNALMDGYDWVEVNVTRDVWTGFRHVYHVQVPITEPIDKNTILYDFVTPTGNAVRMGLNEADSRLFTMV